MTTTTQHSTNANGILAEISEPLSFEPPAGLTYFAGPESLLFVGRELGGGPIAFEVTVVKDEEYDTDVIRMHRLYAPVGSRFAAAPQLVASFVHDAFPSGLIVAQLSGLMVDLVGGDAS
jgi:hypothetical protein